MCGACSGLTPDWARPLVSGPNRRADIARFLSIAVPAVTIKALHQGWSVAQRTGASWPVSNFDDLLDRVAKVARITSFSELTRIATLVPGRDQQPYGQYVPRPLLTHQFDAATVLPPGTAAEHIRLAAFCLGIRCFESSRVAIDFPDREAPFRLVAVQGRILGSVR